MLNTINKFISISSDDPDDARRRKLLNILLIGLSILMLLLVIITLAVTPFLAEKEQRPGFNLIIYGGGILFFGMVILFILNRFLSGNIAAVIFLVLITFVMAFSDTPIEVAAGRSLFVFTIPIIISSVLLQPVSSFLFAGLSSIIITFLALSIGEIPNTPAVAGYFLVAFVSWLSARNLEQALHELRDINTNLDQIVKERTHALAEALTRERIEAGRSQAILESIADGVIVFDTQGSAIQANPALSDLINVPLNNIVNSSVNDLVEASPME